MELARSVVVVFPLCGHTIEFDSPSADDPAGLMFDLVRVEQLREDGRYYLAGVDWACADCHVGRSTPFFRTFTTK